MTPRPFSRSFWFLAVSLGLMIFFWAGTMPDVCALADATGSTGAFRLSSPDFAAGQALPAKCARAHGNVSPELRIGGVPTGAKSLALIVEDPDAPSGLFIHWVLWNVPPGTTALSSDTLPADAVQGKNSHGDVHYDGPSPPSGTHRYFFRLYALKSVLTLPAGADRAPLLAAMQGQVLAKTALMGTYSAGQ